LPTILRCEYVIAVSNHLAFQHVFHDRSTETGQYGVGSVLSRDGSTNATRRRHRCPLIPRWRSERNALATVFRDRANCRAIAACDSFTDRYSGESSPNLHSDHSPIEGCSLFDRNHCSLFDRSDTELPVDKSVACISWFVPRHSACLPISCQHCARPSCRSLTKYSEPPATEMSRFWRLHRTICLNPPVPGRGHFSMSRDTH